MAPNESTMSQALHHFEVAEANLVKLERLWDEIRALMPSDLVFGTNVDYENKVRAFSSILGSLAKIDGWKPTAEPPDLNGLAQSRLDAREVGEISAITSVEDWAEAPGVELREYRFRLNKKRKVLINKQLSDLMNRIDDSIRVVRQKMDADPENVEPSSLDEWAILDDAVRQIDILLGSSLARPQRWGDLKRHISFAAKHDFADIEDMDWPTVRKTLLQVIYDADDAIPSEVEDLADIIEQKPSGPISRSLLWKNLDDEQFERLLFTLIHAERTYENVQWLTNTRASDKGRDLSAYRVVTDPLAGTFRSRVIIQCKHWLTTSVTLDEVQKLIGQMTLWEPPRVDVLIIATSGRFTTDAVEFIEKHNQADRALRVEMWPESHLETLLASKPNLIAEFQLR